MKKKKSFKIYYVWPIKIFFLAITLSIMFGILSEIFMEKANILICILVILIFIFISIFADMIASAVLSCDKDDFKKFKQDGVVGSSQGLILVENAPKIACFFGDVVGDVCGILSGAGGMSILYVIVAKMDSTALEIIISAVISALIAGITILGKAVLKQYASNNSNKIILWIGRKLRFLKIFKNE